MKIQYLNGGLANQTFQYIFARFAEFNNPDQSPFYLDDSFFYVNHVHNGLELEKVFSVKLNLLSRCFEQDVWEEFIRNKRNGISVPQTMKNLGFPIYMITEFDNYKEHNPFDGEIFPVAGNSFHPEITQLNGEYVYYHGYWLHPRWFFTYRDAFLKELQFPPIADLKNRKYADRILNSHSVAVHVRRGDYVTLGWETDSNYYRESISKLLEEHSDLTFFLFSDDMEWCKAHEKELGLDRAERKVYVEGNIHGKNYIDLQLMSLCNIILAGKSAFSYLAALLDTRLEQYITENQII